MKSSVKWIFIFTILCALCAAAWIYRIQTTADYKIAEITQNGEIIRSIDLTAVTEPYEFIVNDAAGGSNTIRVEYGRIAVIEADCPDKVCVNQGFITDGSVPIVCLPHKLAITMIGSTGEYDGVSGGK